LGANPNIVERFKKWYESRDKFFTIKGIFNFLEEISQKRKEKEVKK
jgi:hypothetical protein